MLLDILKHLYAVMSMMKMKTRKPMRKQLNQSEFEEEVVKRGPVFLLPQNKTLED